VPCVIPCRIEDEEISASAPPPCFIPCRGAH
jgi:hypothetical protein